MINVWLNAQVDIMDSKINAINISALKVCPVMTLIGNLWSSTIIIQPQKIINFITIHRCFLDHWSKMKQFYTSYPNLFIKLVILL